MPSSKTGYITNSLPSVLSWLKRKLNKIHSGFHFAQDKLPQVISQEAGPSIDIPSQTMLYTVSWDPSTKEDTYTYYQPPKPRKSLLGEIQEVHGYKESGKQSRYPMRIRELSNM